MAIMDKSHFWMQFHWLSFCYIDVSLYVCVYFWFMCFSSIWIMCECFWAIQMILTQTLCNVLLYLWHDCVNPASFPPICFPIPEVLPHSCYILPFARNNVSHDQNDIYSHSPLLFQSCTCVKIAYTLLYTVISSIALSIVCRAMVGDFNDMLWDLNAMLFDLYAMLWDIEIKGFIMWYTILCFAVRFEKKQRLHIQKMSTRYEVK